MPLLEIYLLQIFPIYHDSYHAIDCLGIMWTLIDAAKEGVQCGTIMLLFSGWLVDRLGTYQIHMPNTLEMERIDLILWLIFYFVGFGAHLS